MVLKAFGELVTASDVERRLPEDGGPTHFVRVCGALIRWALVEQGAASADLRITERLNVPDRGVDAECILPGTMIETGGFVGPGRTIFQFKFRDAGTTDSKAIVASLAARLRQEVRHLPAGCDRYVLMTNVHLAGTEPSRLRKAIAGAPALATKPIIVWGAAEIAHALNVSPGLRHLFSAAGGLSTVDVAEVELQAAYRKVGWAPLVNRVRELSALRDFIESATDRVLRVQGARFSGRTRLVIEAIKQSAPLALWVASAEDVTVDLLRALDSSHRPQLLVVDDDDDEAVRRVLGWAEQREHLKTIVIARGEVPFGNESDAGYLGVREMERTDARMLLRTLAPGLPLAEQSWIIEGATGLPGLIAHLAAVVAQPSLRSVHEPAGLRTRIARLLSERYEADLEPGARQALEVASVCLVLGVEGTAASEVAAVAKALGRDPDVFASHRRTLERAGFLRRRGRFVEVVPPLLAEHLAGQALTDPERVVAELGYVLSAGRFCDFLRRLSKLPEERVRAALERVLKERCDGLDGLHRNAEVIRTLAPAAPGTAIRCIEEALNGVTAAGLAETLKGETGRTLVSTLENLAFRSESFEGATRQLLTLAEAESDTWQNNATGVFLSLFHWAHPELPATLSQRLAVLKQGATGSAAGHRKIVADAAGAAFKKRAGFRSHHPSGPHLPEPPSRPQTLEELGRYGLGVIDLLQLLRRDGDTQVRDAADTSVIEAFRPLISVALGLAEPCEGGLPELAQKAVEALGEVGRAATSARTTAKVATNLELLSESRHLEAAAAKRPALVAELRRMACEVEVDLTRSPQGRLWRAIGPPSWKQRRRSLTGGDEGQDAAQEIATEMLEDLSYPALFESHLAWLMGDEAQGGNELFRALGARDTRRGLLSVLLAVELTPFGEERLGAYIRGWAERDGDGAGAQIGRLVASRPDLARCLLGTIAGVLRGRDLVERVHQLIASGVLERHEFATQLASLAPWEALTAPETEELLTLVDDGTRRVRGALLLAFAVRLMRGGALTPTLREQAWSFLESSSRLEETQSQLWWDDLAAKLGETEPQRLLALVENVGIQAANGNRGKAAWHLETPLIFEALRKADRPGFIRMLLRLASYPDLSWQVEVAVEEEIDPRVDRETLLVFARDAGVVGARTVALNLSATKRGFWEVARDILTEWGEDEQVRQTLLSALAGDGWSGSPLPMITERLDKATALRSDPSPWVASWAQEAVSFFDDWRRRAARDEQEDWIWDYRIRRAELEAMVQGQDSPEKLWAVGRLLEHAPEERVRELLTPEEILEALDKIPQLPEAVRARWEPWARHWEGRH